MLTVILRMSLATVIYVVLTALLWHFWHKRSRRTLWLKIAVGLFYGGCSIASTHLGIDYQSMILNVRDIGPLAAGLFFDPLSGILAGIIGGTERFFAMQCVDGVLVPLGAFTKVACSISTLLAGFLSAALYRWIYEGTRPSATQSFFLGAVMEVFHMYVVLITHRDDMYMATVVVQTCSVPMIVFTAVGMFLCSCVVKWLSGESFRGIFRLPRSETPVYMHFQRWLLVMTMLLFLAGIGMNYAFQTFRSYQEASLNLRYLLSTRKAYYENSRDLTTLEHMMDEMDLNSPTFYILWESDGKTLRSNSITEDLEPTEQDLEQMREHLDGKPFMYSMQCLEDYPLLCVCTKLEDRFLMLCLPSETIYQSRTDQMYENVLSDILVFTVLYVLIAILVDELVVKKLGSVNRSLNRITEGHLDEVVSVRSSSEFSQLSDDINKTVTALRGYIDAAEKRMEEELRLAAAIQDAALPKTFTFPRNDFEIYALMTPARQVGGDFYDFFFIGDRQLALVIADVSGKGVPASLFMMRAMTAIRNFARSGSSPARLLSKVNHTLCEGNDAEMFVTVWIGIIDLSTGEMKCANAGHEYPVLMRAGGSYELVRDKHGLVLAAMDNIPMREYEMKLGPGDRLFVYTDGVPEAINSAEEAYGTDRLVSRLNALRDKPEQETLESVLQDIRNFAGEKEQFDDITMIGFTYRGPGENPEPGNTEKELPQ